MRLARLALKAVFLIREVVVDAVMATRASSTFHIFRMSELISPIARKGVEGCGRFRNLQHKNKKHRIDKTSR